MCHFLGRCCCNVTICCQNAIGWMVRPADHQFDDNYIFMASYTSPPDVAEFPDVVVPVWERWPSYIGAGGLHNSQHQHQHQPFLPGSGKGRAETPTDAKKGYCFAFASAGGCSHSARKCQWTHVIDPKRGDKRGGGNGNHGGGSGPART